VPKTGDMSPAHSTARDQMSPVTNLNETTTTRNNSIVPRTLAAGRLQKHKNGKNVRAKNHKIRGLKFDSNRWRHFVVYRKA